MDWDQRRFLFLCFFSEKRWVFWCPMVAHGLAYEIFLLRKIAIANVLIWGKRPKILLTGGASHTEKSNKLPMTLMKGSRLYALFNFCLVRGLEAHSRWRTAASWKLTA